MQQFSKAYSLAVASVAACSVEFTTVDIDSVDATFKRKKAGTVVRSAQVDVQLKATYKDCVRPSQVAYALDMKTYDELRATNLAVPRLLVVVVVPDDFGNWVAHSESELLMRKCGYWLSLRGAPNVSNEDNKTLYLPRTQVFDPAGLDAIFTRLEAGKLP